MNSVQLAPLNIGSSVCVKTTTMGECTGTYEGYFDEKRSIWLNDAKWYRFGADAPPSYFNSLILPLDIVAHIEGIQSETDAAAAESISDESSLVKLFDIQLSAKPSEISMTALNCFAARKFQLNGNIKPTKPTQMQEFCKELFNNCNFAHLLQMQAKKHETKFCIRLPSYYASFFRQPKWCFEEIHPPPAAPDQSLAVIKPDIQAAIDVSLADYLQNSNVTANETGAGDTEQQNPKSIENAYYLNLSPFSTLSNLNLNGNIDNKAGGAFENVEVEVSNLQMNNSFAQIKIGDLCFKTVPQLKSSLIPESMPGN